MTVKNLKKYILLSTLLMIFFHFFLWLLLLYKNEHAIQWQSILRNLNHWDSGWYTRIIENGYESSQSIAFYPFYPFCLYILKCILPFKSHPQIIGTLLSTFIFLGYSILVVKLISYKKSSLPSWLIPKNLNAWLILIVSPASYVFHTSHTESLYLVLSYLSIYFAYEKKWITASILAGLCALTKNQGVILSIFIAILSITYLNDKMEKLKVFLYSGLISGSLYSIYLIYQFIAFSDPFAFISAQIHWHHVKNISEYFKTFLLQNSVQDYSLGAIKHQIYYFIMLFSCFPLWKMSKPIFFYCLSCLLIMPLQADLINSFRYTTFLFPIFFILGSYEGRFKKIILPCIFILFLFLNIQTTFNFFILKWAY